MVGFADAAGRRVVGLNLARGMLLIAALAGVAAPTHTRAQTAEVTMLVQSSPLAGFQFYKGKPLWDDMQVGDALTLVREPDNAHDPNAVRVEWRGNKLGYVPRRDNRAVARHLDGGVKVEARISRLTRHRNPWQRIEFEVFVRL